MKLLNVLMQSVCHMMVKYSYDCLWQLNNIHIRNKIVSCKLLLNRLILYFNHKGGQVFSEVVLTVHSLRTTVDSRAAHVPVMFERNAHP